ncbi:uroporphyrinogen-III synthase [Thiohalobacter sp. IOR34]|uniref:uroporphyrinogen-III synthase n=1 Tax=Thiohalobacter sp. IOR34 TaxID=3057176 RepID=UPI0025B0077C|nr:uroporphyrinogen-III synthase [Thiohalobacter sp. IOR34]WJW75594.1 uroporphyrinogen-III synthase [Thiohalobacter sp. IOR34]
MAESGPLAGVRVLVTRPAAQAGRLQRLIEAAGGRVVIFPVLEIAPPRDPASAAARLGRLADYDLVLFVSANAVRWAREAGLKPGAWPAGTRLGAVGRRTAEALRTAGFEPDIVPAAGHDSEALLAEPGLTGVGGQRVLIVRGEGGRERLRTELEARGATVDYAEVYRRRRPAADPTALLADWAGGGIDVVTVSSLEGLQNLVAMLGENGQTLLRRTALIVPSRRVAEAAAGLGLPPPWVAADATDEAMLAALREWVAVRGTEQ